MDPVAIGADLGGTHIKAGVVDAAGRTGFSTAGDTPFNRPAREIGDAVGARLWACVEAAKREGREPAAVGVALPGWLETDGNRIRFAANLPSLADFPLRDHLSQMINRPVLLEADSNAAAWGEFQFGAGRSSRRLLMLTVGTGIGGAVILDGELVRTTHGTAGSLGHILVEPEGPRCACGACGCLERMAGSMGIEEIAREQARAHPSGSLAQAIDGGAMSIGYAVGTALAAGDPAAGRVVQHCGTWLGIGVAALGAIFRPDRVVVGGGIAGWGGPLLEALTDSMRAHGSPAVTDAVHVSLGALGAQAGVVGVAHLALRAVR